MLELFASSPARGVTIHRVPVLDAAGNLVKLITLSGIAKFLAGVGEPSCTVCVCVCACAC